MNDSTGDWAILECINGEVQVYHSRKYKVMTNQPTYDKQLENLKQYRGFGGDKRLPGTHEGGGPIRPAAIYVTHLPKPNSDPRGHRRLMSVMRTCPPLGIADLIGPNVSTTIWRTITDLSTGVLYYDGVMVSESSGSTPRS